MQESGIGLYIPWGVRGLILEVMAVRMDLLQDHHLGHGLE